MQFFDSNLHQSDLNSLQDGSYLTAEAIYFGMQQCESKFVLLVDPSLATYMSFEKDWEDLKEVTQKWNCYKYVVFVINDSVNNSINSGSHWATLIYIVNEDGFIFIDSMGYQNQQIIKNACFLGRKIRAIIFQNEILLEQEVQLQLFKEPPMQINTHDCGVYSLAISKSILQQGESDYRDWNFNNITPDFIYKLRKNLQENALKIFH